MWRFQILIVLLCFFLVLYIGRRIVYLFVLVFCESNCWWQCVLSFWEILDPPHIKNAYNQEPNYSI